MTGGIRFLESSKETSEVPIIDVKSLRGSMKAFNELMSTWKLEARKEFKTTCERCIKSDYERGEIKDEWEDYWKDLTKGREHIAKDPKKGIQIGIMMDFNCSRGHGVCLEVTYGEYKRYLEYVGVKDIIERTGVSEKEATSAYNKNTCNIELAIEEIESKPKTVKELPKPKEPKDEKVVNTDGKD